MDKDHNADFARARIAEIEAGTPSIAARKRMAEIVIMRENVGRYDAEAIGVWRKYLTTFDAT